MELTAIYAQLNCADQARSAPWFTTLFGREPDLFEKTPDGEPMPGLAEWIHSEYCGLQLYSNDRNAGYGTLTLIVPAVRKEHERLSKAGLKPGEVEVSDFATLIRLTDPDGNLVVLAQRGRA